MKINLQIAQRNKTIVWEFWTALEQADPGRVEDIARLSLSEDIAWFGHDPVTPLHGVAAFVSSFWQPLCQSFPAAHE